VLQPRPVWQSLPEPLMMTRSAPFVFRVGLPDAALFPHRAWRRAVSRALAAGESTMTVYEDAAGHDALRAAIARQISFSRGVRTTAADVLVTNGTQQALDLVARVLLSPGETVAVEEPGYGPPRFLFHSLGLRVVGTPVDTEGVIVDALPKHARAVYVTPSHQFPLSVTMSLSRRKALLVWAERHNAVIIEDDYDSEFRFDGRPCEPLQTLDTDGRVVYVGSFSKSMLPALRVGFLVAPASLRLALRQAKFVSDWHGSTLMQAAIAAFIDAGDFARHIRRMTGVYRARRRLVTEAVDQHFAGHLELVPSTVGLHLAARARRATPEQIVAIAECAAEKGVAIQTYWRHGNAVDTRPIVALGYGAIPTECVKEGLRLLRRCFTAKVD
jgi:GntR family transcriptional regulator/MocR family aminotransferase